MYTCLIKLTIKLYFLKTYNFSMIITHLHSTNTEVTMMKVHKQSLLIHQLQHSFIGLLISICKHCLYRGFYELCCEIVLTVRFTITML